MNQTSYKYRFSFTAASLLLKEFVQMAQAKCNGQELMPELMGRERAKTGKREFIELILRLEQLNNRQLDVLAFSNGHDQQMIAHLTFATIDKYRSGFIIEILKEKVSAIFRPS